MGELTRSLPRWCSSEGSGSDSTQPRLWLLHPGLTPVQPFPLACGSTLAHPSRLLSLLKGTGTQQSYPHPTEQQPSLARFLSGCAGSGVGCLSRALNVVVVAVCPPSAAWVKPRLTWKRVFTNGPSMLLRCAPPQPLPFVAWSRARLRPPSSCCGSATSTALFRRAAEVRSRDGGERLRRGSRPEETLLFRETEEGEAGRIRDTEPEAEAAEAAAGWTALPRCGSFSVPPAPPLFRVLLSQLPHTHTLPPPSAFSSAGVPSPPPPPPTQKHSPPAFLF